MSSGEESSGNLPSAADCDKMSKEFCAITETVSPEAIQYLQQNNWNLDKALTTYYAERSPQKGAAVSNPAVASGSDPNSFKVMSWNLDGLDPVSLGVRTRRAMEIIKEDDADIVFLQELAPMSWDQCQVIMGKEYHLVPAPVCQYFTAVLLKKATVQLDSHKIIPFPTSQMMRKLQVVLANVKGVDVKLMNSHLESTGQHSEERVKQLNIALDEMTNTNENVNVIFGGDTNLGGRDFNSIVFPENVKDLWEELGCDGATRYTWDTQTNDNKEMRGPGRPRCRFDRLYLRKSAAGNVEPKGFQLSGIERVKNCSRFPSDHWAIIAHFLIKTES